MPNTGLKEEVTAPIADLAVLGGDVTGFALNAEETVPTRHDLHL